MYLQNKPLGFKEGLLALAKKIQTQDPLEEVDIGDGGIKKPTYISIKIDPIMKVQMIELLKEFKDSFALDYDEIPWLNRELVE